MLLSKFDKSLSVAKVAVFDAFSFSFFIVQSHANDQVKTGAATDDSGNFSDLLIGFRPSTTY